MVSNSLQSQIKNSSFSPFMKRVWLGMLEIPKGKVTTYQSLAKRAGNAKAARAVGNACNANPFSPQVPCHRIVSSSGALGGFAQGVNAKIKLLKREGVRVSNGMIVDFESKLFEF